MTSSTQHSETDTVSPTATSAASSGISATALLVAGAFFMEYIDGTVIATALPQMARSFGVQAIDLNIGISAYLLTLAMLIPASGWIAERFGARNVFGTAVLIFSGSSLLCGFTHSVTSFVAARVIQGIGGALMVPVGRLAVLRTTPKDQLITAIATLTWPGLVAPIIGPALGGFITTYVSWHWIFFINVPLGCIAIFLTWKLMPNSRQGKALPFDGLGFASTGLAMLGMVSALELCSRESIHLNWIVWLGIGGLLALGLSIHHLRHASFPLVRLQALQVPSFRVTMCGGFIFRITISSAPFMLPLMFQVGFGMDAFHAGLLVLAVFAGNLAMKTATTPLIRHYGFRPLLLVNGVFSVLSLLACALLTPSTPEIVILITLFIGGLCRSMQFTAISSLAFAEVPDQEMSSANTLYSASLQLAAGLGVTLGALCIRSGEWLSPHLHLEHLAGSGFRLGFVLIALCTAIGLIDMWGLAPNAGETVSKRAVRSKQK
jgi:EmrB/QacA subfamily drug resistance transporter